MAKALERPLLLPKDMDALKCMRQLELFLSLKRDLAMVSSSALFINSDSLSFLFCFLLFFIKKKKKGYSLAAHMQAIQEVAMGQGCRDPNLYFKV